MKKARNILILGGGFTGLRLTYLLDRLGYSTTLVEAGPKLGGMVQTFSHTLGSDAFLFDYGPHLFFADYRSEYEALIGEDLLTLNDRFGMFMDNRMLSYPLRIPELLTKLPPITVAAYIFDFIRHHYLRSSADESSLDAYMTRRFGHRLFEDFYAPYIEKCCGLDADRIDIQWAKERENVSGKNLMDNIVKKLRSVMSRGFRDRLKRENDPSARQITAWYPRNGAGQICDAMVDVLQSTDCRMESEVTAVHRDGGRVTEVEITSKEGTERLSADFVVSTIPLPTLIQLFSPASAELIDLARSLQYRMVRLVNLIVGKERVLDCLEIFSMDRTHLFKRIYEPKAMSPVMAPDHMSSLCLEVCCNQGDEIAGMPDQMLVERCVSNLVDMELIKEDEVKDAFVVDIPHAYPVYDKDFGKRRAVLLDAVSGIDNLVTCGRQGLFRYHAMTNEVMAMADSVVGFLESDRDKARADRGEGSRWGVCFY